MKVPVCFLVLICFINSASAELVSLVEDNFNSYTNGPLFGQGDWERYYETSFDVQGGMVFEGAKALYYGSTCIMGKRGNLLTDGRQTVCVRTEDRNSWNSEIGDGNAQIRISKGLNFIPNITMSFKKDGHVAYYDPNTGAYQDFATYVDDTWTLLETEWRSSDKTARYRINNESWTDWKPINNSESFIGFDYVGLGFSNYKGSGGVYFDTLGSSPVPEPSIWILLITASIFTFFFLRRKN